jgi:integrase/recombinase XerD
MTTTGTDLQPLLAPWATGLRMRSSHTARSYGDVVGRFLATVGAAPLDREAIAAYLDSLSELAPASRAHHVSAVRAFLRHAADQGLIEQGPRELLIRPRVTVTSFGRYLTIEELRDLVAAARAHSPSRYAVVMLLAGTGLRVAEAAGATWRDLFRDPEGRLGLRVLGKGSKERVVKIRDDVFAALVAVHGSNRLDARDTSPLLIDRRGTGYSVRGIHKLVAQTAMTAGISKPVSPHWLRHTHATLAASNGASVFTIQQSLGHSRIETSQRYIHWARGLADSTADALPALG